MKNTITSLILFVFTILRLSAQNLVPNYSFEDTNTCDFNTFRALDTNSTLQPSQYPDVLYWLRANQEATKYAHRCYNDSHSSNLGSVPSSAYGYQQPRTGNAYTLIYPYFVDPLSCPHGNPRSYLQVHLTDTLKKGHIYCGDFYINPSYTTETYNIVTTDAMAMCLTKHRPFNNSLPIYINANSQAQIYEKSAIVNRGSFATDSATWHRIHGLYKAKGGEKWLTIGNFYRNDSTTLHIIRANSDPLAKDIYSAFFFVDDVSLFEISPPIFTTTDTTICQYPFTLVARGGYNAYLWSTNATALSCTITQAGKYWVRFTNECGTVTDTINVRNNLSQTTNHRDTTGCLPITLTVNKATTYTFRLLTHTSPLHT
jgi:hypothetical protein